MTLDEIRAGLLNWTNRAQSILTVAIPIIIAASKSIGCTEIPNPPPAEVQVALECSQSLLASWFSPDLANWYVAGVAALKLVLAYISPGGFWANMLGVKTVVTTAPVEGTVSPAAVKK